MLVTFLIITLYHLPGQRDLKTVMSMDEVGPDAKTFLQSPTAMDLDHKGRLLVLDVEAKTVFVWNKDGTYLTHFGRAGSGPGEFNFAGSAGLEASLVVFQEQIYLWDGGSRKLQRFSADFTYKDTPPLKINGRVERLSITQDGRYVVFYRKVSTQPLMGLALYSPEGTREKEISEIPDPSYSLILKDGAFQGIKFHFFVPEPVFHHDMVGHRLVYGNSDTPSLQLFQETGQPDRIVRLALKRYLVTDQDKAEIMESLADNPSSKADFAQFKPYYTQVIVYGKGYLVCSFSAPYRKVQGSYLDAEGNNLGSFSYTCGEMGGLFGVRGRLFSVGTNVEGDFFIRELEVD